uniref:Ig-like domain-containing protein n=1 Tax=Terrapene triunguis TaxID=2587831 RepID=A0A674IF88_9SAUR
MGLLTAHQWCCQELPASLFDQALQSKSGLPPEVTVFPEDPVELGEPNVLICFVDKFFPPALSVTWLKNGQEGDFYDCRVEHGGLSETFTKHWGDEDERRPQPAGPLVSS